MKILPAINTVRGTLTRWMVFSAVAGCLSLVCSAGCQTHQSPISVGRAHYLYHSGHYEKAIDFLDRELLFRPSAEGYYLLGASYYRLFERSGDLSFANRAEAAFRMALQRDPDHAPTYYELSGLLVRQGRVAEARRLIEDWATRNPGRAEPRVQLARIEWLTGNKGAAEDQLIEALAIEPKNSRALAALGMIREESGLLAQAQHNYRMAAHFDPTQPKSFGSHGRGVLASADRGESPPSHGVLLGNRPQTLRSEGYPR